MKTKKSLTKRFKITKKGKVLRMPTGVNHNLSKKSGKEKRKKRKLVPVEGALARRIKRSLRG